jgi:hypothetical protein
LRTQKLFFLGAQQRPTEARCVPKKKSFCGASLERKAGLASENKIKKTGFFYKIQ